MFKLFKKKPNTINSMTSNDLFHHYLDNKSRHWMCRHYGCSSKELHIRIVKLYEEYKKEKQL